jgi:predicted amidophosphoribosyltransferase
VLDVLLPRRCPVCSRAGVAICERCVELFPRVRAPLCERCGAPAAWPVARCRDCSGRRLAFASVRSAVVYDGAVRALVGAWKERGLRRLVETAAAVVVEVVPPPTAEVLTFVPADPDRGLRRGHEPPRRLAELLGSHWELPVEPLLRRARATKPQRGLSRTDRRRNVRRAFAAAAGVPARVALVDDVYTSGATANAAASALRAGGAREVAVVTFARVVG